MAFHSSYTAAVGLTTLLVLSGCSTAPVRHDTICADAYANEDVIINGPTLVGLFEPATPIELDQPEGHVAQHFEHMLFALEHAANCTAGLGVQTTVRCASELRLHVGTRTYRLKPRRAEGCDMDRRSFIFADLGREPLLESSCGVADATALSGAAVYFNSPSCMDTGDATRQ